MKKRVRWPRARKITKRERNKKRENDKGERQIGDKLGQTEQTKCGKRIERLRKYVSGPRPAIAHRNTTEQFADWYCSLEQTGNVLLAPLWELSISLSHSPRQDYWINIIVDQSGHPAYSIQYSIIHWQRGIESVYMCVCVHAYVYTLGQICV